MKEFSLEYKTIGLNIAYYRKLRGLTQMQLAERVNISRTHMSNIEAPNAKTSISINKLFDIADALDVDPADIDQEQIVRSCQIHAMMPMMQFSVAPWRILSKENMEICRAAAWKHVELAPYLIEKAKEGAITGVPVARPMEFEFPGQDFEGCNDQYMLGEKYLIAPMLEPGTVRTVKLPKGRWQDETGRKYKGGKTYDIEVPMDRIPVFTQVK